MNRAVAAFALVFVSGTAQADRVPFFAKHDVPDYSASMVERHFDGKAETWQGSIVQHDGWTRIEGNRPGGTSVCHGNFFANVWLCAVRIGDGDFDQMDISNVAPARDFLAVTGSRKTEDTDIQAGERCTWWEVMRERSSAGRGPFWLSCLTDDGIEVRAKVLYSSEQPTHETRLTSLARRPVAEAEVNPPARLFDPSFWLKPLREYPDRSVAAADFEVTMSATNAQKKVLRHYPWHFEEIRGNDGSIDLTVWNELENQGIFIMSSPGEHRVYASRSPRDAKNSVSMFDTRTSDLDLKQHAEILGEHCIWFDMMPKVAHATIQQCLTADGIPLSEVSPPVRGRGSNYTAVSFQRRAVDLKEMLPAPELLDPATCGFAGTN
jgi:hypothetical protein